MATIKDVASLAGVSIATVSRVMNRAGGVRPEVEQRVQDAVRRLGYRQNNLAAGLRTRTTRTVGLVVNNIYNPFYGAVAQGVEDVCRQHGYCLILCNARLNPDLERQYLEMLLDRHADGVVISPCSPAGKRAIQSVVQAGMSVVQVNRELEGLPVDTVVLDNLRASAEAVQCLADLGHTRIATIAGPESVSTGSQRLAGFMDAMTLRRLTVPEEYVRRGDFSKESGYRECLALLGLPEPPTALVVANNEMATGALQALREQGVRLPDDLSFITVDDPEWAEFYTPPLTVVRQPVYTLGTTAASQLLSRLTGTFAQPEPVRLVLTPQLVVRQSCGVPRSGGILGVSVGVR